MAVSAWTPVLKNASLGTWFTFQDMQQWFRSDEGKEEQCRGPRFDVSLAGDDLGTAMMPQAGRN
jgi:hypothetical protein